MPLCPLQQLSHGAYLAPSPLWSWDADTNRHQRTVIKRIPRSTHRQTVGYDLQSAPKERTRRVETLTNPTAATLPPAQSFFLDAAPRNE